MTESDYLACKAGEYNRYVPKARICPVCEKLYLWLLEQGTNPTKRFCEDCEGETMSPESYETMIEEELADAKWRSRMSERVDVVARMLWDRFARWPRTSRRPEWDDMDDLPESVEEYREHARDLLDVGDRARQPILHERDENGNWICCCGDHLPATRGGRG